MYNLLITKKILLQIWRIHQQSVGLNKTKSVEIIDIFKTFQWFNISIQTVYVYICSVH